MYGLWLDYKITFRKNKQTKNQCSTVRKRAQLMNERRQPSTEQKRKKMNKSIDLNYIYTEKSILCTNVQARVMLFRCHARIVTVHAIYEDLPIVKLKSPLNNILSYFVENALVVLDY